MLQIYVPFSKERYLEGKIWNPVFLITNGSHSFYMLLAAGKKTKEICVCVSINIHIHTSISIYFLSHKFIPISSIPTRHQQVYPSPPLFHIYNSSNTKKPGSHFPQHTYLLNPSTENCFRIADPCLCDKIKINEKPSR